MAKSWQMKKHIKRVPTDSGLASQMRKDQ